MPEINPDYVEIQTPWWSPAWVRDNPEKAAPAPVLSQADDAHPKPLPFDECAVIGYLAD